MIVYIMKNTHKKTFIASMGGEVDVYECEDCEEFRSPFKESQCPVCKKKEVAQWHEDEFCMGLL